MSKTYNSNSNIITIYPNGYKLKDFARSFYINKDYYSPHSFCVKIKNEKDYKLQQKLEEIKNEDVLITVSLFYLKPNSQLLDKNDSDENIKKLIKTQNIQFYFNRINLFFTQNYILFQDECDGEEPFNRIAIKEFKTENTELVKNYFSQDFNSIYIQNNFLYQKFKMNFKNMMTIINDFCKEHEKK